MKKTIWSDGLGNAFLKLADALPASEGEEFYEVLAQEK